jgi:3-dehydroquinate synthase
LLDGFGEMIKYALIGDGALWNEFIKMENIHAKDIKKEWINSCITFKNKIVQEDLYDQGLRHILNFGHTIGHALEAYYMKNPHSGENNFSHTISHGHAIALGIITESYLSFRHHLLPQSTYEEIRKFILQLFQNTLKNISVNEINDIVQLCLLDKKNIDGCINITMLEAIGKASPNHWVSKEECAEAIAELRG